MNISVYAHINKNTEVIVELQEGDGGKYAVIGSDDLVVLIYSREKLLEISSLLENAAQKWEGEE